MPAHSEVASTSRPLPLLGLRVVHYPRVNFEEPPCNPGDSALPFIQRLKALQNIETANLSGLSPNGDDAGGAALSVSGYH